MQPRSRGHELDPASPARPFFTPGPVWFVVAVIVLAAGIFWARYSFLKDRPSTPGGPSSSSESSTGAPDAAGAGPEDARKGAGGSNPDPSSSSAHTAGADPAPSAIPPAQGLSGSIPDPATWTGRNAPPDDGMATAPTRPGPVPEYSGTLLQFRECVRAGNVDELGNWLSVLAGDARFRPELRIMADRDPHSTVRAMAFRVLGECGDEESRSLFESHLQRDEAWNVRSNCAWALGKTGDPSALSLLRKAAADDPSEAVRAHSQAAVRRLESPPPR